MWPGARCEERGQLSGPHWNPHHCAARPGLARVPAEPSLNATTFLCVSLPILSLSLPPCSAELEGYSAKQLKQYLREAGRSTTGLLEKRDLLDEALETLGRR